MKHLLVAGAFSVSLAACAGAPGNAKELSGSHWKLVGAPSGILAAADTGVTLEFSADSIAGSSGCNSYTASYTREGDKLTLGAVSSTKRGCADAAGAVEAAWYTVLRGGTLTVTQDGEGLQLMGADGASLRFAAQATTP